VAPYGRQQFVLADHMIAVADQIQQQVEDLWLDMDRPVAATQLACRGVE
jgi:hypothetical protein